MWSAQLRLIVLLVILPAVCPVFCTQCSHQADPNARYCGACGKMLDQVNLLTTFTLLGTSAFLSRSAAKNSTPTSTAKRSSTLTPAGPSAKKKQAPKVEIVRNVWYAIALLAGHMNTHKGTRRKIQPTIAQSFRAAVKQHDPAGDKNKIEVTLRWQCCLIE